MSEEMDRLQDKIGRDTCNTEYYEKKLLKASEMDNVSTELQSVLGNAGPGLDKV